MIFFLPIPIIFVRSSDVLKIRVLFRIGLLSQEVTLFPTIVRRPKENYSSVYLKIEM